MEKHGLLFSVLPAVRLRKPFTCIAAIRRVIRECEAAEAEVIVSWGAYGHLFGSLAGLKMAVPSIWYQIGFARGWVDRLASMLPAKRILAVSHHVGRVQKALSPSRDVIPIWPGVDLEPFLRTGMEGKACWRSQLNLPPHGPLAVMVGRLQRWKGMHTAIAAMAKVRSRFLNAHLVIVGGKHDLEPDYAGTLERLIRELALEDVVTLVGRRDNVAEWMSAADVVVHASSEEPFGIVVAEGMACGRPVITGSDGGVREAVRHGVEGLHVAFEDDRGLAAALIEIFEHPQAAAVMGIKGIARAQQFTRERYVGEICRVIDAAVAGTKASATPLE